MNAPTISAVLSGPTRPDIQATDSLCTGCTAKIDVATADITMRLSVVSPLVRASIRFTATKTRLAANPCRNIAIACHASRLVPATRRRSWQPADPTFGSEAARLLGSLVLALYMSRRRRLRIA